jgi:hypothetical protein
MTARELCAHLFAELFADEAERTATVGPMTTILECGPLSRRILTAVGNSPDRAALRTVYGALCECLARNALFVP